jgi:hypothetical protein
MKATVHIIFWVLMTVSALCKMDYTNVDVNPALIVSTYLASVLAVEMIMFYVGYGFARRFLDGKKKFRNIGYAVVGYVLIFVALPLIIRKGVEPFTWMQIAGTTVSALIDHFAWFAGGIITRYFFDTKEIFAECENGMAAELNG